MNARITAYGRLIGLIAAGACIGLVATPVGAAARSACDGFRLETLDVTVTAARSTYRSGEVAKLTVTVMHPREVLLPGNKAAFRSRLPVEGAEVSIFGELGPNYFDTYGVTAADGTFAATWDLPEDATGAARLHIEANKILVAVDDHCLRVDEYGWVKHEALFRVRS